MLAGHSCNNNNNSNNTVFVFYTPLATDYFVSANTQSSGIEIGTEKKEPVSEHTSACQTAPQSTCF